MGLDIILVNVNIFDEAKLKNLVQILTEKSFIKFFINTKNVRLAKTNNKKFDEIGYKEVSLIQQENSQYFIALVNIFLPAIKSVPNGAIINAMNLKNENMMELRKWDIMFFSTS